MSTTASTTSKTRRTAKAAAQTSQPLPHTPGYWPSKEEQIAEIRAHAVKNYTRNGWDYVVEALSDQDLLDIIGKTQTYEGAIDKAREFVKVTHEVRAEVQAEAF